MAQPNPAVECHLTEYRNAKGMTQEALAAACGLTRQAISQIEAGTYCPNSLAALQLARTLGCRVEDLFVLPEDEPSCQVRMVQSAEGPASRINVVKVRNRWLGYPLTVERPPTDGFAGADALVDSKTKSVRARLLLPKEQIERTALLVGCDPGLGILLSHVERHNRDVRLLWLSASSQAALDAVRRGEAHVAGTHLPVLEPGEDLRRAARALGKQGGLVVAFVRWEQGLMVRAGNPKGVKVAADLARSDVRLINREPGAGSRAILDELLRKARVPRKKVQGYGKTTYSHLGVAHAVRFGGADVGVGLRAVAHACQLDFIPLTDVRFDFVIPRDALEHPAVAVMLDLLQSQKLRSELAMLPGYDVSCMGSVITDLLPSSKRSTQSPR